MIRTKHSKFMGIWDFFSLRLNMRLYPNTTIPISSRLQMIGRIVDMKPVTSALSKKLIWDIKSFTMDSTPPTREANPLIIHQPNIRKMYRKGLFVVLNKSS